MKKTVLFLLSFILLFSLFSCSKKEDTTPANPSADNQMPPTLPEENTQKPSESLGETLRTVFKENSNRTVQEIAETILSHDSIKFMGSTAPVEPGDLAGFKAPITDFGNGVMFAPNISSIPFIGYVFEVSENADAFSEKLRENADPRWNICTEAEETIIEAKDGKVFFLMCPKELSNE